MLLAGVPINDVTGIVGLVGRATAVDAVCLGFDSSSRV